MSLVQIKLDTPLATLYLVASPQGLLGVHFQAQQVEEGSGAGQQAARDILTRAAAQLTEYVAGQRQDFELTLDLRGSEFQKNVWRYLGSVPYGQTRSYKEVAVELGKAGAFRAVGNANAKNPLCIVVPCHRIIASDGSLGGYSGGVCTKRRLLQLEAR